MFKVQTFKENFTTFIHRKIKIKHQNLIRRIYTPIKIKLQYVIKDNI